MKKILVLCCFILSLFSAVVFAQKNDPIAGHLVVHYINKDCCCNPTQLKMTGAWESGSQEKANTLMSKKEGEETFSYFANPSQTAEADFVFKNEIIASMIFGQNHSPQIKQLNTNFDFAVSYKTPDTWVVELIRKP